MKLFSSLLQTRRETGREHGEEGERSHEEGDQTTGDEHQEQTENVQRAGERKSRGGFTKLHQRPEQRVRTSAENGLQSWSRPWEGGYVSFSTSPPS